MISPKITALSAAARSQVLALTTLLLVWLICFADTLWSMITIWLRSDTYAHGILIFPITLFLIWRKRRHIAATPLRHHFAALPLLLLLVISWYFADAVDVNVVSQLAVVLMLPVLVWLCLGWRLFTLLRFPLLYLLFAVPMGDNLVPWLQDITADITVAALQLTNIPVYRDGLYLSTPTGLFLVAEACSGIRYLIASVALGTLYAYLTYTSRLKQGLFCLAAVLVPILANGVRAYGIVLIASLTDMQHAVGVDHLIYGWLFFGFVIFIMFFIGGFFADKHAAVNVEQAAAVSVASKPALFSGVAVMLLPFMINALIPPLTTQPLYTIKALQQSLKPVTDNNALPQFTDSSAQLAGIWQQAGQDVWFYAAFYQHVHNKKLVSWQNQPYQVASWTPAGSKQQRVSFDQRNFTLQELDLRAANGQKRLLWYWYGSGDYWSANPYLITAMQALGRVLHFSQHGSFIALSVYYDDDIDQARAALNAELDARITLINAANTVDDARLALANRSP